MTSAPRTALPGSSRSVNDQMARGLGYVSIALGLADLIAPRGVCRAGGLEGHEGLVRACGGRELATGLAILGSHDATPWVWGRVVGDAIDIATVAAGAKDIKSPKTLALLALLAAATGLDLFCATRLAGEKGSRTTARADYHDRSGFPRGVEKARETRAATAARSSSTRWHAPENTAADAR